MLRIFATIAPSIAASRSASSKIRNGALPPSSIETFSTCSAAWAISLRPTSVEPVKLSLRRRGSEISGSATAPEEELVMTFSTPGGSPHSSSSFAKRQHRERRQLRGLDHHRAAGRDRRADLAGSHRGREVPRGDEEARSDGLPHHQHPALAVAGLLVVAVDSQRLAGEPAEELGRVGDLGLRLGHRLAHLERHQQRQLVGALVERLEGALEDLAALVRRRRRPLRLRLVCRRQAPRSRPRGCRRRPRRGPRQWPGPRPRRSCRRPRRAIRRRSGARGAPPRPRRSPFRSSPLQSPYPGGPRPTRQGTAAAGCRGRCRASRSRTPRCPRPRAARALSPCARSPARGRRSSS